MIFPSNNLFLQCSTLVVALQEPRIRGGIMCCPCTASAGRTVLKFLNNAWGLGAEKELGCSTGPPRYIYVLG
jgi:hypothetical protein